MKSLVVLSVQYRNDFLGAVAYCNVHGYALPRWIFKMILQ
jgi:hypothetical protein